jgi:hypothetical protein
MPSPDVDEGAVFEPRSVRAARGRPLIAVGAIAAIAALVVAGTLTAPPPRQRQPPSVAEAKASPQLVDAPAATERVVSRRFQEGALFVPDPIGPGRLVRLSVESDGDDLLVRGQLLIDGVIVVVVSLRDPTGRTTAIQTVSISSEAARAGVDANRFTTRLPGPTGSGVGPATLHVNGYDRIGAIVASADLRVPPA